MAKLTLSVDAEVIARAKRYARERGTSVSRLVEGYLNAVSRPMQPESNADTSVLSEAQEIPGQPAHGGRSLAASQSDSALKRRTAGSG